MRNFLFVIQQSSIFPDDTNLHWTNLYLLDNYKDVRSELKRLRNKERLDSSSRAFKYHIAFRCEKLQLF